MVLGIAIVEKKCFYYHVTSRDHVIESLFDFIDESPSWKVTTLQHWVVIGQVEVEI